LHIRRIWLVLALAILLPVWPREPVRAAGSSLTLQAPDAVLGNGDDFATTVLGDPWDMSQRRDIGWEENFASITAAGGVWSARQSVSNPAGGATGYVFPLFQGFPTAGRWARSGPTTRWIPAAIPSSPTGCT